MGVFKVLAEWLAGMGVILFLLCCVVVGIVLALAWLVTIGAWLLGRLVIEGLDERKAWIRERHRS